MRINELFQRNIDELQAIQKQVSTVELADSAQAFEDVNRVFFSGMGRSGNMVKALAIRFMHLGFETYVAGDASTPSIQAGDLLVAVTSSAKTKVTLNHIETAEKQKAKILLISSKRENPNLSDYYLCLPAKTEVPSMQHAGSLFEQSVLIAVDAIAAYLIEEKQILTEYMDGRHANLQ